MNTRYRALGLAVILFMAFTTKVVALEVTLDEVLVELDRKTPAVEEDAKLTLADLEREAKELLEKKEEETRVEAEEQRQRLESQTTQSVRFTNYYPGDALNSTSSISHPSLTMGDMYAGKYGFMYYNGMVAVATATYGCLNSSSDECQIGNHLPSGYSVFQEGDTFTMIVNGEELPAIVIDACGACFWDEDKQRVDVLVSKPFGNLDGYIRY